MTVYEFADRYLRPYTQKGAEIVPELCPFCHGGDHKDKYSFALNAGNKTYNCKRGSCGNQGHFTELCRKFGEESDKDGYSKPYIPQVKKYKKPETKAQPADDYVKTYLGLRKISESAISSYKVGSDGNGNIVFPFYDENGEHIFTKFRPAKKVEKGERKSWRETDTKPILFGMHLCEYDKPLCITEGEIDAMSLYEAGIPNAVSVPSGSEDFVWVDTCWEWLKRFDKIILFGDNDGAGLEMIKKLSVKLSDRKIYIAEHEYKDANELLYRKGAESVKSAYNTAKEAPVIGLIDLAGVMPLDVKNMQTVKTSIGGLNKLLHGFKYGDVSVWTGKRGEGKSTLLSEILLDAVEYGVNVCAYSGEIDQAGFQYWVDLQAAGKNHIESFYDHSTENEVQYVPNEIKALIHSWYSRKFWLYDNLIIEENEESSILGKFEIAAKRYDCKVFLIDNLMTVNHSSLNDKDFYRAQSTFVGKLVQFAKKLNVHVHLIAHPRKTGNKTFDNDDVSGSGDITNRPANVFSIKKLSETDAAVQGFDVMLEVTKNRWHGKCGKIGLNYCPVSRRLYVPSQGNDLKYGWEDMLSDGDKFVDITSQEEIDDLPWEGF